MTLGRKLTIATTLGIASVLTVNGVLRAQREVEVVRRDIGSDHRGLAHALTMSVEAVAERSGPDSARGLVHDVNSRESRALIRWLPGRVPGGGRGTYSVEVESAEGVRELVTRVPIALSPRDPGYLELRESLAIESVRMRDSVIRTIATMLLTIVICGVVILTFASWLVTRPMQMVLAKLKRVGDGELGGPLVIRQRDEMGTLAEAINAMCAQLDGAREQAGREMAGRLATLEQLRHADRLGTVGQLASGIAHELGTPLNVISVCARMIETGESTAEERTRDARIIGEQANRMTTILQQLLQFARRGAPSKQMEALGPLVQSVVELLRPLAARRGVDLRVAASEEPVLAFVDPRHIQQVVTNLVVNAIQAVPPEGHVEVAISQRDDRAELTVHDDGPPMPEDVREHVFEPFFTTKDVGEGTGLGLSVAYGIVAEHGGTIAVESRPTTGTRFTVVLPTGAPA
ncbi:MAG: HAMP domain-containing histidine kinase [Deltaproteobacteria bacterium]|nr:HAMP domain-containing histidine kinase [Deltaproteobacteria bacterium]